MRAIQMTEQGRPDVLRLVDIEQPTAGAGQVLIKVESASVNYADVMRRAGITYPFPTPLPFIPGGEVAGTVADLGPGVDGPPLGTPVFAVVGSDGSGGYAEYAVAGAQQVIPVPAGLTNDQAAGIVIAGVTATLLLTEIADLRPGQSVLVPAAAGGVGSYAVQIAKELGAGTVIGAASTPAKRDTALTLGADHAIAATAGWHRRVRELTGGTGVDLALEMTGGDHLTEAVRSLAPFGKAVVYGMSSGREGTIDAATWTELLYQPSLNQSILTYNLGVWFGQRPERSVGALTKLIGWIASGQIQTPAIRTMPLADAAVAHQLLQDRVSAGKIILKP